MWPQGGAAGAIARSELLGNDTASLSHWSAPTTVVPIPKGLANATVGNFRDPSRAVQLPDGKWYLAVGSDDGRHGGPGKPDITKDGVKDLLVGRDDGGIEVNAVEMRSAKWHGREPRSRHDASARSTVPLTPHAGVVV